MAEVDPDQVATLRRLRQLADLLSSADAPVASSSG
jgi:hypothetical protein